MNKDHQLRIYNYNLNPTICRHCCKIHTYEKRNNKFCNSSCAATFNNLNSSPDRKRGPNKLASHLKAKRKHEIFNSFVKGPYTILKYSKCKHLNCDNITISRTHSKYCVNHKLLYSMNGRGKYQFRFSLSDHPTLFDSNLIKKIGFRTKTGTTGLTRDHKVSVNDAIRNNYDPYYITHPINCDLIPYLDNCRKHTKSSITYYELISAVNEYDKNWCLVQGSNL